jgi:hypothetical protein
MSNWAGIEKPGSKTSWPARPSRSRRLAPRSGSPAGDCTGFNGRQRQSCNTRRSARPHRMTVYGGFGHFVENTGKSAPSVCILTVFDGSVWFGR